MKKMIVDKSGIFYREFKEWKDLNVDKIVKYVNKGRSVMLISMRNGTICKKLTKR